MFFTMNHFSSLSQLSLSEPIYFLYETKIRLLFCLQILPKFIIDNGKIKLFIYLLYLSGHFFPVKCGDIILSSGKKHSPPFPRKSQMVAPIWPPQF